MAIIQSISPFFQTLQIPFKVYFAIKRQQNFFNKNIDTLLADAQKKAGGSLDDHDLKKNTGYYGLMIPAIFGEAFCVLRNEPMTKEERLVCTCMAAMRGLADDFFDKQNFTEQDINDLVERPEQLTGNTAAEKLFIHFYKTALANAPQPTQMQQQFYKVFEAELLSKQQHGQGLSYEVNKDITIRRGAEWLLFYRTAFDNPLKKGEEKMLYGLGGVTQLSEDIFDLYADHKAGKSSLITTATKVDDFWFLYSALLQVGTEAAYRSGYARNKVRKFLNMHSLAIFSPCYVCMDQLKKNQKRTKGVFDLKAYSKKELTYHREGFGNKLKSLWYYFRLSRPKANL